MTAYVQAIWISVEAATMSRPALDDSHCDALLLQRHGTHQARRTSAHYDHLLNLTGFQHRGLDLGVDMVPHVLVCIVVLLLFIDRG